MIDEAVGARRLQPPVAHEPREQLGVVDHLVVAAEVRVLVGERVEAVRAVGDDLRDAGLVERLDVLLGERLEHVLVADPPGRVAGAALARAEDREVDAGLLQQLRRRLGGPPRALVERRRAADPVQVLGRGIAGLEHPARRARRPSRRARTARLPHGFDARSTSRSIGSASAGKLDSTITRWRRRSTMWSTCSIDTGHACDAGAAGHAVPDRSPRAPRSGRAASSFCANTWSRRPMITSLGESDLAGGERGAGVLAAAALGARERVEHLLPGQVLGGAGAEAELLLGDVVVVELQRLEPAARAGAPEPHVDRGARRCAGAWSAAGRPGRRGSSARAPRRTRARGRFVASLWPNRCDSAFDTGDHDRRPLVQAERDPRRRATAAASIAIVAISARIRSASPRWLPSKRRGRWTLRIQTRRDHADQHEHGEQVDEQRVPALMAEPRAASSACRRSPISAIRIVGSSTRKPQKMNACISPGPKRWSSLRCPSTIVASLRARRPTSPVRSTGWRAARTRPTSSAHAPGEQRAADGDRGGERDGGGDRDYVPLAFLISAEIAGTISCRSPITA